jgi:hypothetical protein
MEPKKITFFSNSFSFGILTAVALIIFSVLLMALDLNQSPVAWFAYAIMVAFLAWGTVNYRNKAKGGYISYGKAYGSCMYILLFASIILSIFMFVYLGYIDTAIMEKAMLKAEEDMIAQGLPDEQIEIGMKYARMFSTPTMISIFVFLGYMIFGAILSLIIAAFIKKDNPNPLLTDTIDQPIS